MSILVVDASRIRAMGNTESDGDRLGNVKAPKTLGTPCHEVDTGPVVADAQLWRTFSASAMSYFGAFDLISKQQRGRCARSQHS